MRVLQLFNRYRERGGEEKSVERIFNHLGESCEVDKIWWDSREWDSPDGPGVLGQLKKMFDNPDSAKQLREKIEEFKPDVLLCHNLYPVGSPAVYREAKQAGLPVVQYVHNFRPFSVCGSLWTGERIAEESLKGDFRAEVLSGSWQGSVLKSLIFAILLKRLHRSGHLEAVKKWVCISDFMRDRFVDAGLPATRVEALRHSWDIKNESLSSLDGGYYLFLSRLVPEKGVTVLLDAWQILAEKLGERVPKLIIGGTGAEEKLVADFTNKNSSVSYVGFVEGDEKSELISNCRAMLAPSVWWEPLGLVTYEAYDYGKPMIAAASGGLSETVEEGVTGFLCKRNDAEDLARVVAKLESMSSDERILMGKAGREKLEQEFTPSEWKNSFQRVLQEVVESK